MKTRKIIFLLWIVFGMLQSAFAQKFSASLSIDTNQIEIGDWVTAHVEFKVPKFKGAEKKYQIVELGQQVELVRTLPEKIDTYPNLAVYHQRFVVSAYDSGVFQVGPFMVTLNDGRKNDTAITNYLPLYVSTVPVDTTQAIKPINTILDVPYVWKEFVYWYAAGAVLLALLIALYFLWKWYTKKKPEEGKRPPLKVPLYVWVRGELKKLEEEKLWQKDEVKQYYSRLTDIVRMYLEYRYNWNAMEATTEEIALQVGKYDVNDIAKDLLLGILRNADLVKFAKVKPAPDTNMLCIKNAYDFVEMTKPAEQKQEDKK
ncbi:MAG: hypothetical protein JNK66_10040 [Chitinophagales bacterium]|nr:hypothetical protein [Chitinophagales bacterium]